MELEDLLIAFNRFDFQLSICNWFVKEVLCMFSKCLFNLHHSGQKESSAFGESFCTAIGSFDSKFQKAVQLFVYFKCFLQ